MVPRERHQSIRGCPKASPIGVARQNRSRRIDSITRCCGCLLMAARGVRQQHSTNSHRLQQPFDCWLHSRRRTLWLVCTDGIRWMDDYYTTDHDRNHNIKAQARSGWWPGGQASSPCSTSRGPCHIAARSGGGRQQREAADTMGAYLSQPVTDKESEDGECGRLRFGVSAMQVRACACLGHWTACVRKCV